MSATLFLMAQNRNRWPVAARGWAPVALPGRPGCSRRRLLRPLLVAVLSTCLAPGLVRAQAGTATIEVLIRASNGEGISGATVHVHGVDALFARAVSAPAVPGSVILTGMPPGSFRIAVEAPGFWSATGEVQLLPGESRRLAATLTPAALGAPGRSGVELLARHQTSLATSLDADQLCRQPSGHDGWSLIETVDPLAIVNRIDDGGLYAGEPARIGSHGGSWTQTRFRWGEADVTSVDRGGTPLVYPDVGPLQAVHTASALLPIEEGGPGPIVTMVLRRPSSTWRGAGQVSTAPNALQPKAASEGVPSIARYGSWSNGQVLVSGPAAADRAAVLGSATVIRWQRFETDAPSQLGGHLGSFFGRLVFTPRPNDELTVAGTATTLARPFEARARFSNRDISEGDGLLHFQGRWERFRADGSMWSARIGYERGTVNPNVEAGADGGTVERLRDGPVSELIWPAHTVQQRWEIALRFEPAERRLRGLPHRARIGMTFAASGAATSPIAQPDIAETVDGLPARVWEVGYLGPESRWSAKELVGYAADRISLHPRLSLEAGARLELSRGSAQGAADSITWWALSPRASARWALTEDARLAIFGGYGRYGHRLPLQYLAVGDPRGPGGFVYRWNDTDGDRVFQHGERGALIANVGPCCAGSELNRIDPGLKPPHTDEFVIGVEHRFGHSLAFRFAGVDRREHNLVALVNDGVTQADYTVTFVPDPGTDYLGTTSPQLLPIYDRSVGSFGHDHYTLVNPPDGATHHQGIELTLETLVARRFHVLFGGAAYRSFGLGVNRGFRDSENDQGLLGELYATPNALTHSFGKLFFDRGYLIKWSGWYVAPHDINVGVVARYQDGQPFARLVIAPSLNQGAEIVQANDRGSERFTYTLTLDARIEKGFRIAGQRVAAVVEVFNFLNWANEVEENVVTGPSFRTPAFTQPPRAIRLGVRVGY